MIYVRNNWSYLMAEEDIYGSKKKYELFLNGLEESSMELTDEVKHKL